MRSVPQCVVTGNIPSVVQPPGIWGFITIYMQTWPPVVALAVGLTLVHTRRANTLLLGLAETEVATEPLAVMSPATEVTGRTRALPAATEAGDRSGWKNGRPPRYPAEMERIIAGMERDGVPLLGTTLAKTTGLSPWQVQRYLRERRHLQVVG